MAKEKEKITKADLSGFVTDAAAFDNLQGETFAGLNVLKLAVGQTAGPLVVTRVLRDVPVSRKSKKEKGEKVRNVDKYFATAPNKTEYAMPISASFVLRAREAKLDVGDTFFLRRGKDYKNPAFANKGASYELKITARAEKRKTA